MSLKYVIVTIIVLSNSVLAQESLDTAIVDEVNKKASLETSEKVVAPSPLIAKDQQRPRAIISSLGLDPDRALVPVSVISINDYPIDPLVDGYSYHLAPGSYELKVQPDAGNLLPSRKASKNFTAKSYRIEIKENANYLMGARIKDTRASVWELQLFQLQQRLEVPTPD